MEKEININGQKYVLKEETDKHENENKQCNNCVNCYNSTSCHNSTFCYNSTYCYNCAYCLYCDRLVLEKYHVFNKPVTKEKYKEIVEKISNKMGIYKHPKKLSEEDISWLKNNIKEFDEEVLNKVIQNSILSDKPKK